MKKIEHLAMTGISKSFHGIHANKDISFGISAGEILGLLGENGAGKTTLMNILYGLYQPDDGQISINHVPIRILSPVSSIRHGIGMVHQHFMLVQNHTVIENIALSYQKTPFFFPAARIRDQITAFSKEFNFHMDPDARIWQLSAGEQQRVEIIKALMNGADLLILDEPTSVLTPSEIQELMEILTRMKARGHAIIFISHKLDEIQQICDRVVVLRKGQVAGSADTRNTDKAALARMMVGRDVMFTAHRERLPRGETVLTVADLHVTGDKGLPAVRGLNFDIRQNEIFGIAGVAGNGQRELAEAITGIRPVAGGRIFIRDRDITHGSARTIHDQGVSHVPEERIRFGIAPGLFVYDNAILKQHHHEKFSRRALIRYDQVKDYARQLIADFNIFTPSIRTPIRNLSGGNIQKLILGREISGTPHLLVASHPTYGLDVGATEFLRTHLLALRKKGGAILLISEDLDEIFELSDRIGILFAGQFMGILDAGDPRLSDIGLMMAGSAPPPTDSLQQGTDP